MFCPLCGAPNDEESLFCGNCGAVLDPENVAEEAVEQESVEELDEAAADDAPPAEVIEAVEVDVPEVALPADESLPAPLPPPPPPRPRPVSTPKVETSGLAIASLVSGIVGWTIVPFIGSVLAIILGYMARNEIRQRPGELEGEGLATAGLVLGWLAIGLSIVALCFVCLGSLLFFGAIGSGGY